MSLDYASFQDALISHAKRTGLFDKVAGHEMKNGPGLGVHCEIFTDTIDPAKSGLAATSVRLGIKVRVRCDMLADPQDGIDPRIVRAAGEFMASVTADFEVEGQARYVDVLGAHGIPLSARSGYVPQDGKQYRAMDIIVPIIINDVFPQEA
jgi:hypothetical protein